MSLGIYSCASLYGPRALVLFDNPKNLRDGQPLLDIDASIDEDDDDFRLYLTPVGRNPRCEYVVPCTEPDSWHLVAPMERLSIRPRLPRDEGVLLTILTVFFVGRIDLEVVDTWLGDATKQADNTDMEFPKGHIVAEPFGKISADLLRPIILEHYDIALARLEELEGV